MSPMPVLLPRNAWDRLLRNQTALLIREALKAKYLS